MSVVAALEKAILAAQYVRPPGCPRLTLCVLTLRNGFVVTGESVVADEALFSEKLGEQYALVDARSKALPYIAYALRDKEHAASQAAGSSIDRPQVSEGFAFYRKKNVQPMRPYLPGESLDGISVNKEDVPELGGMIAVNPANREDKWYIGKQFFADNYEAADPQQPPLNPRDRVLVEKCELDLRLSRLRAFLAGPVYADLSPADQGRLAKQAVLMTDLSEVLGERIEAFDAKAAA